MRKSAIPAVLLLVLSAAVAIGGGTFLSPCAHPDGTVGACHWAGRALQGTGCALFVTAALALFIKKARTGAYLGALPVCALGMLIPGTLIDLCRMSTMRCRMIMRPAMLLLFSAAFLCALAGALLSRKE